MRAFMTPVSREGARVGATYALPVSSLSERELADEQQRLTLQARTSFGAPPPPFCAYYVDGDTLHVPRFYGLQRFGPPQVDARALGEAIVLKFEGSLSEVQSRATNVVFGRELSPDGLGGVIISLPCGMGKTVWAVHAIARLGRKAIVLVHKRFLRDQWAAAFRNFCPGVRVGFIEGKTWEVDDRDVVIAMVMTIARREFEEGTMACFGTVVYDEAHHIAAPVMNLATRVFHARYSIGLTATKHRPDGLTPLLHWCLGPEGFHVERDAERVRVSVALFEGGVREILSADGKPIISLMLNRLAVDARRNRFIADRILAMRAAGRVVIVLSDRLAQLRALRDLVLAVLPEGDVGIFSGGTKEADRHEQLRRPVLFCSYGMANEGLDKREADTCVMATPKSRVVQCIGRIQRPCATKMSPLVLDIVDDASVFTNQRWRRQKMYSKEAYDVQIVPVASAREDVWFA
jgi:superfamily II DNA or RNA helicase